MTERDRVPQPIQDALREAFISPPDPAVRTSHLHAMAQVEIAGSVSSVARPKKRRRLVRGMAAGIGLVLIGGSALAATGDLPLVQDAVADLVDGVVDIPGGNAKGGDPKNPRAAANKAEAEAFTEAKKAYNACRKAERSASPAPVPSACGEKPERTDFEVTKTAKPENSPKAEKTPRPERTEKPERTHVAPGQVDRTEKPDRTPKPARTP